METLSAVSLATYKAPKHQDSTDSGEPPFQDFLPHVILKVCIYMNPINPLCSANTTSTKETVSKRARNDDND
ncbi:hypothetical protein L208DRAFT_1337513 [Tricholoma matsutake]|nr:hypothetical protein L208DRAFT_1337513 [Tricholoma matsutake 945]